VLCVKLIELKPKIEELKSYFKILRGSDRIEGCRTWDQFCDEKLGRTASAVRKMLAGPKQKPGILPANSVATKDTSTEADQSEAPEPEIDDHQGLSEAALAIDPKISEAERGRVTEARITTARGKAVSSAVDYLSYFDKNGERLVEEWVALQRDVLATFKQELADAGTTVDLLLQSQAKTKKPAATVPDPMQQGQQEQIRRDQA
jgi:hypothetical protein